TDRPARRRRGLWLIAAGVMVVGVCVALPTLHLMTNAPERPALWMFYSLALFPIAHAISVIANADSAAAFAVSESVAITGVAVLVAAVYLVVIVGIDGKPKAHERDVLLASLLAAVAVALLAGPLRRRLAHLSDAVIGDRDPSTEEVANTFVGRMSRAVPMDELLLQLAEALRDTIPGTVAEIWTGTDGVLTRAVSVPHRQPSRLELNESERTVIAQARIGGPAWAGVWLPSLLEDGGDVRFVPMAHLGELLGVIVVRRPLASPLFTEDDERPLVELARQLGLALHNVRLDSALQASLAELAQRNEELQASRLRIVQAADESRRAIERNLHDGAQQHLVALAVKLGLAAQIAEDGDTETVMSLVTDLRGDVQTTIGELRELAHGIYPPLLRDRGLGEALRAAASRSPLPCAVEVKTEHRFPEEVEAAVYFCCLEAMQNAGKHAGDGAQLTVQIADAPGTLCVEVADDGAGFDASVAELGHGFVNMRDRLGAIGAELDVDSAPGAGTRIRTAIPVSAQGDSNSPRSTLGVKSSLR
ncbi:MAG TPA: histidine kinase, partial [Frankiaceae bacterium]|nr:histidine kinase [Frankiaceae bacterium]